MILRTSGILLVYNTLTKKMEISSTDDFQTIIQRSYDKMSELKAFDGTKAGIKGLVDAGITKVPRIFMLPPKHRPESSDTCETQFIFPVIDLEGIAKDPSIKRLWTKFDMRQRHGVSSKWLIMTFQYLSWKKCCKEHDDSLSNMLISRNNITLEIIPKK